MKYICSYINSVSRFGNNNWIILFILVKLFYLYYLCVVFVWLYLTRFLYGFDKLQCDGLLSPSLGYLNSGNTRIFACFKGNGRNWMDLHYIRLIEAGERIGDYWVKFFIGIPLRLDRFSLSRHFKNRNRLVTPIQKFVIKKNVWIKMMMRVKFQLFQPYSFFFFIRCGLLL